MYSISLLDPRNGQVANKKVQPVILSKEMTSQENFTPNSNLIICPQHGQEYASKVCTYINCDKKTLMCNQCIIKDPDHYNDHYDYIVHVGEFLMNFDEQEAPLKDARSNLHEYKPAYKEKISMEYYDILYNEKLHIGNMWEIVEKEKKRIEYDLIELLQVVADTIQDFKVKLFQQTDDYVQAIANMAAKLRQKFVDANAIEEKGDEFMTREKIEKVILNTKDSFKIDKMFKAIRDNQYFKMKGNAKPVEADRQTNQVTGQEHILAKQLRKLLEAPPTYKDSSVKSNQYMEIIGEIPIALEGLLQKFKELLTFQEIPTDTKTIDQKMESVSQDFKSAQIDIRGKLFLNATPQILKTHHQAKLNCMSIINDKQFAIGACDGQISLWDLETLENLSNFQGHKGPVISLIQASFNRNLERYYEASRDYLVSGSTDSNVILWNLDDELDTLALRGHKDSVTCLLSLQDGHSLISGSADRKIILWDIFKEKLINTLPCNGSIYQLHLMKEQNRFASSDFSQAVNIWSIIIDQIKGKNVIKGIKLEKVIFASSNVTSLNSSYANPSLLFGGCADKTVKIWNIDEDHDDQTDNEVSQMFGSHNGEIQDILLIEKRESIKGRESLYILSVAENDSRMIINKYPQSREDNPVQINIKHLNLGCSFTNSKLQIVKTEFDNQFKIIVVNQHENYPQLYIYSILEGGLPRQF